MVNPREKEMAEMRARYAKIRGQKKEEPVKEEPVEETSVPQPQKVVKETNPYVRLMQEDIENLIARIKKILGLKGKSKPLNISWLEKNNRRFWK
jgi:hypothetical protein